MKISTNLKHTYRYIAANVAMCRGALHAPAEFDSYNPDDPASILTGEAWPRPYAWRSGLAECLSCCNVAIGMLNFQLGLSLRFPHENLTSLPYFKEIPPSPAVI